jgi:hypothetical protein
MLPDESSFREEEAFHPENRAGSNHEPARFSRHFRHLNIDGLVKTEN